MSVWFELVACGRQAPVLMWAGETENHISYKFGPGNYHMDISISILFVASLSRFNSTLPPARLQVNEVVLPSVVATEPQQ